MFQATWNLHQHTALANHASKVSLDALLALQASQQPSFTDKKENLGSLARCALFLHQAQIAITPSLLLAT